MNAPLSSNRHPLISVVTPTLRRPDEIAQLFKTLAEQQLPPYELVLVDGAPAGENETQAVVEQYASAQRYSVNYLRHGGGTAIQRNVGIDAAVGDFIAFIDDDMRLDSDFFVQLMRVFDHDISRQVGGVAGYITNQHLDANTSPRWKWYRRLKLFTTYVPGHFDSQTGYPINRYLQPPHDSTREIDFMGTGCALWRRDVFADGLRFDSFFIGHGVMEDAQLALRARRRWKLLECGLARCRHLHSPRGRENKRLTARKTATNYRYLFVTIVPRRTWRQEIRFWRVQVVQLGIYLSAAVRSPTKNNWLGVLGKLEGIGQALCLKPRNEDTGTF
jgi:glycosyltransferase involved in cell wall biosynthesis